MTKIIGTVPLTGSISPGDTTDVFGTHDASYGVDGLRSVVDHTARNAVTVERRRAGMIVFTQNDGKYWSLNASPWTLGDSDWTLLTFGGGTPVQSQTFPFPTPVNQWVMIHTLGGYPSVVTMDTNNQTFIGDISYPSTSQVVVSFADGKLVAGTGVLRNAG